MQILGNVDVWFEHDYHRRELLLHMIISKGNKMEVLQRDGTWVVREEACYKQNSDGVSIPVNSLQGIADALVNMGICPTQWKSKGEVLEATKEHLNDMRKLVFKNEV